MSFCNGLLQSGPTTFTVATIAGSESLASSASPDKTNVPDLAIEKVSLEVLRRRQSSLMSNRSVYCTIDLALVTHFKLESLTNSIVVYWQSNLLNVRQADSYKVTTSVKGVSE